MNSLINTLFKKHYPIVIFLTVYFLYLSCKLISNPTPFFDWDESIYVRVGQEMLQRFSLVPIWNGRIWLDKPPLVPLYYGIISMIPGIAPEISTRIATLIPTVVALGFLYTLFYKNVKESFLTTLMVASVACTPIFLQRAQVVNIDVFLLIGWLGYLLFFSCFWGGLAFLALAVLSKTLLGFYPAGIMFLYYAYLFVTKKVDRKELIKQYKKIFTHVGILSLWYVIMFALFGKAFWIQHIYETHFRRVASSIESHFGNRSFYVDLITQQYINFPLFRDLGAGKIKVDTEVIVFFGLLTACSAYIIWHFFRTKKIQAIELLRGLYLLPWFVFLNVTKTKISWYVYPGLAPFPYLFLYPITALRKKIHLYYAIVMILFMILAYNTIQRNLFAAEYSKVEPYYLVARYASDRCTTLTNVVTPTTRNTFDTLRSMDLLITSSEWWGDHPSMVYYFGKPVEYIYQTDKLQVKKMKTGACLAIEKEDQPLVKDNMRLLKEFHGMMLYQK